jgi:archaellin
MVVPAPKIETAKREDATPPWRAPYAPTREAEEDTSVDVTAYGLTDYDEFTLQIKPASGAVLAIERISPFNVAAETDLG